MKPTLVLYASTHGHTAKIASRTDWDAVEDFARRCAAGLPAGVS